MRARAMIGLAAGAVACRDPAPAAKPPTGAPTVPAFDATVADAARTIDARAMDSARRWSFDADPVDLSPPGFGAFVKTGPGRHGRWIVRPAADAPSAPNVFSQVDAGDGKDRFALALTDTPPARDVRVSARCRPVTGKMDQACGLVARYRDERNYYVTRANALEDNVRLYHVADGNRTQIANHDVDIANRWYDYALVVEGDRLRVDWQGTTIIDVRDATLAEPGRVGLWTKADSVTDFDDLVIQSLDHP